jgi:hypothetical protein
MDIHVNTEWFTRCRKRWTTLFAALAVILSLGLTAACTSTGGGNASEAAGAQTGEALLLQNQPVPIFPTSAYRANAIMVEAIQSLGTPTTTFLFPPGSNSSSGVKPIKVCASQGLPLAVNASITNPQQVVGTGNNNAVTTGLMDPDGLYSSPSSVGTNVLCLDASGNVHLSYWEGDVEAESGVAVWSAADGIVDQGPSQLPICTVVVAHAGDGSGVQSGIRYTACHKAPQTTAWTQRWLKTDLALAT